MSFFKCNQEETERGGEGLSSGACVPWVSSVNNKLGSPRWEASLSDVCLAWLRFWVFLVFIFPLAEKVHFCFTREKSCELACLRVCLLRRVPRLPGKSVLNT